MKTLLLIATFFTFLSIKGLAQDENSEPNGGKLEALKIAYLTKKLNLTPEEAQRFWPVYNQYANEIKSARKDQKQTNSSELETEDKILKIRKKYNNEFGRALSAEKVNTFFRSERDFGDFVKKELIERRQMRQQLQLNRPRGKQ